MSVYQFHRNWLIPTNVDSWGVKSYGERVALRVALNNTVERGSYLLLLVGLCVFKRNCFAATVAPIEFIHVHPQQGAVYCCIA